MYYVYMLTALHIKVIIQLKTTKSGPILISDIHKNDNKRFKVVDSCPDFCKVASLPIRSFSVVITFSTSFVCLFKST